MAQETLRLAEVERARAEERAAAESKARQEATARAEAEHRERLAVEAKRTAERRTALVMGVVFLGLLVGGGGAWWGWDQYKESRRQARTKEAESWYFQAEAAMNSGQLDEAVEKLQHVFAVAPDSVSAHVLHGDILRKQHKPDEAIAAYRRAAELQPDSSAIWERIGIVLLEQERFDEAIVAYGKAVELGPKEARCHYNLGVALERKERFKEAAVAYRKAVELNPNDAVAFFALGNALKSQGKLKESITACREAIRLKPDFADAYYNLGCALADCDDYAGTVDAYRKAWELQPNKHPFPERLAQAYGRLGRFLEVQGKFDEAVAAYCRSLEIAYGGDHDSYKGGFEAMQAFRFILEDRDLDDETLAAFRKAIRCVRWPFQDMSDGTGFRHDMLSFEYITLFKVYERQDRLDEFRIALEQHRRELPDRDRKQKEACDREIGRVVRHQQKRDEIDRVLPEILRQWRDSDERDRRLRDIEYRKAGWRSVFVPKLELAERCASPRQRLYGTAVRLYAEAVPSFGGSHSFDFACAAALAGCGQGNDAAQFDGADRAAFRKRALAWLWANLTELEKEKRDEWRQIRHLNLWHQHPALAGVREQQALAQLPPEEREEWVRFWADAAALRKRVAEGVRIW
jgi:tetratricopeptide (TPR) repeat protein